MKYRMERRVPEVGRRPGSFLLPVFFPLLVLGACASTEKPSPASARKPDPPASQRLAWMPLDPLEAPAIAKAVNDRMSSIKPAGTSASVKAAVSMEVAQLAIECIQPTPACYGAVGRSLGADRLMWAELDPSGDDEKVRLTVLVFDVQAGTAPRRVAETFAGMLAAQTGAAGLVERAVTPESASP
jgi:hypothetical protein